MKHLTRLIGSVSSFVLRGAQGRTFLTVVAALIGLATGGTILLFNWSVESAGHIFGMLFDLSRSGATPAALLLVPFIPALGGMLVGITNTYVFRMRAGHGVVSVILAARFTRGTIRAKSLWQTFLSASLSIGSGGGGGREGPIIHIGAIVGSIIANAFRLSSDNKRTLIAAGAAAGISGIFNAPIGGVLFVLEVILGDFRLKTFVPLVVASVTSTALTRQHYGAAALVHAPPIQTLQPVEYVFMAVLGVAMGLLSAYFTRISVVTENFCKNHLPANSVLRPGIGGLLVGLLIIVLPKMMEQSYDPINAALSASIPLWMLIAIAFLKPFHTALTVGSGGTGGMFAPAMKVGAMAGSAAGIVLVSAFPGLVSSPTPYALAGMGALLAGTMHAPITAILMVIEIANDYGIVLPVMLTSVLAVTVAQKFVKPSIYTWSIESSSAETIGSYAYLPALSFIQVETLVDTNPPRISPVTSMPEILRLFEATDHDALLVVDEDGIYRGLIEFEEVRSFLTDVSSSSSIVAADVLMTSIRPVYPDTTLDVVMDMFDREGWRVLPVLVSPNDSAPVGILSSTAVHRYYRRSVARES